MGRISRHLTGLILSCVAPLVLPCSALGAETIPPFKCGNSGDKPLIALNGEFAERSAEPVDAATTDINAVLGLRRLPAPAGPAGARTPRRLNRRA
jgi:hypothetical protein